jgi:splicing factor U2AF subunit
MAGGREEHGTPERRSPTPEGAVPLSKRIRRASGWDVCAPGYEGYTAMQAKHTGKSTPRRCWPGAYLLPPRHV